MLVRNQHFYSFTVRLAPFSVPPAVHKPSFEHLSLEMDSNFHTVHPSQPYTTSLLVQSLVEPLYAKVVHFCSFVTKSNESLINLHDTNHEQ